MESKSSRVPFREDNVQILIGLEWAIRDIPNQSISRGVPGKFYSKKNIDWSRGVVEGLKNEVNLSSDLYTNNLVLMMLFARDPSLQVGISMKPWSEQLDDALRFDTVRDISRMSAYSVVMRIKETYVDSDTNVPDKDEGEIVAMVQKLTNEKDQEKARHIVAFLVGMHQRSADNSTEAKTR